MDASSSPSVQAQYAKVIRASSTRETSNVISKEGDHTGDTVWLSGWKQGDGVKQGLQGKVRLFTPAC